LYISKLILSFLFHHLTISICLSSSQLIIPANSAKSFELHHMSFGTPQHIFSSCCYWLEFIWFALSSISLYISFFKKALLLYTRDFSFHTQIFSFCTFYTHNATSSSFSYSYFLAKDVEAHPSIVLSI